MATNNRQQAIALRRLADVRVDISGNDFATRRGNAAFNKARAARSLAETDNSAYNAARKAAFGEALLDLPQLVGLERTVRAGSVGNTKEASALIAVERMPGMFRDDQKKFVQGLLNTPYVEHLFYVVNLDDNGNAQATPAYPSGQFQANRDRGLKGGVFKLKVEKVGPSGKRGAARLTVGSPGHIKHARATGQLAEHLHIALNLLGVPALLDQVKLDIRGALQAVRENYADTVTDAQKSYGAIGSVIANATNRDARLNGRALDALQADLTVGKGALKALAGDRKLTKTFGSSIYETEDGTCNPFKSLQASGNTTNPTAIRAGLRTRVSKRGDHKSTRCGFGSFQQDPEKLSKFTRERLGVDSVDNLKVALRNSGVTNLESLRAMQSAYNADAPVRNYGARWRSDDEWQSSMGSAALTRRADVQGALARRAAKASSEEDFDFDF